VVVTSRSADGQETVEVAHEALIQHWQLLQSRDRNPVFSRPLKPILHSRFNLRGLRFPSLLASSDKSASGDLIPFQVRNASFK
jgi:hypothetical protein